MFVDLSNNSLVCALEKYSKKVQFTRKGNYHCNVTLYICGWKH